MSIRKEQITSALVHVIHPGFGKDLITLDLIQDLIVQDKYVAFTLELTEKNDALAHQLKEQCSEAVRRFVDPEAVLDITVGINISRKRELEGEGSGSGRGGAAAAGAGAGGASGAGGGAGSGGGAAVGAGGAGAQRVLGNVKNVIAVASGKGGVGKSTVAANLAVSLAASGLSVGLMDTDIYGPSVPTMFGVQERPSITTDKKLVPIYKHGVHLVSMGFLVDPDQAMIWRGPMATSAIKQFMQEVKWPDLDVMVLDLPPGTGDIQLTIVQTVPLTGAVIVSTPQKVALDDALKGVAMFAKVNVPVLGIIENMAYFSPPDMPEKKYYLFGKHGARRLADRMDTPFLGEIPIREDIRERADSGVPVVIADPESASAKAFREIAERVKHAVDARNKELEATEKINITIRP